MSSLVARNFRISVAVLLAGCLVNFWQLSHAWASVHAVYGGFSYRLFLGPVFAFLATSVCWFAYYRNDEGYFAAFFIGFFLVATTISTLISSSFSNLPFSKAAVAIALYAGISHICYGLLEWRSVFETLGQESRLG
jgi:hypothetical protein